MADDELSVQLLSERLKRIDAASEGSKQPQALVRYEVILEAFKQKQIAHIMKPVTDDTPMFPSAAAGRLVHDRDGAERQARR